MVELIIVIATLAIVIIAWGKISKGIDWAGSMVGKTSDIIEDAAVAGSYQTARAVTISRDTLKDDILASNKKEASRQKERKEFEKNLTAEQKKAVEENNAALNKYLTR